MRWHVISFILLVLGAAGVLALIKSTTGMTVTGMTVVKGEIERPEDAARPIIVSCPTMHGFAERLAPEATHLEAASTAEALRAVREGDAEFALVGRKALPGERDGLVSCALAQGVTLVTSDNTRMIAWESLSEWRIHTALPLERARDFFPVGTEIITEETREKLAADEAVLITWDDFSDEPLLIPMRGQDKDPRFRTPFLYATDEERLRETFGESCCGADGCPRAHLYEEATR